MPGMSGVELQAHLLSQGYRVPFISHGPSPMSGFVAQRQRRAICYLTKPFGRDSLFVRARSPGCPEEA